MSSLDTAVSRTNPSIQDPEDSSDDDSDTFPRTPHRCTSVVCHCGVSDETTDLLGTSRNSTPQSADIGPLTNSYSSSGNHCHDDTELGKVDKGARRKLIIASVLCLLFMIGEIAGGFLAHSLALISDGAHLLTDFASFMISLLALYLGTRRSTKKLSFGWYRAEVLGALVSILLLWVLTGILCYSAGLRIVEDNYTIDAEIMLITAACGVFFNVVLGVTLHQSGHGHSHGGMSHAHSHGHSHSIASKPDRGFDYGSLTDDSGHSHSRPKYGSISEANHEAHTETQESKKKDSNINVRAAFVHVVGDLLQSVGVLIAAFIVYFKPEWKIADPICTFLFSVFVVVTTVTILRDILVVLMEGTPRNINFADVRDAFFTVKGIKDIHDLRLWSLTLNKTALSVHIAVEKDADPLKVIKVASFLIQKKFGLTETTMQIEEYTTDMLMCLHCQHLKD
ncbi:zinc transporter 2-like isoform X1 [Haliotis rufescens]|uniref:zinc transporter 2-like isoform X1 n=1 Tax=Haliotis rufescens TaxID=6454 RepID=UPI001EB0097B|nr:zinc transporter 2-like isoform X1 [Haliotis rufescens]